MAGTYTKYRKLYLSDGADLMSNPDTVLDNNWDAITSSVARPVVTGTNPPVAGTYNLYERVYNSTVKDVWMLVTKDPNWGEIWRPTFKALGPWATIPNSVMRIANWSTAIDANSPFQIALDNRGRCFWRGLLGTTGTTDNAIDYPICNDVPVGIRPARNAWMPLGLGKLNLAASGFGMFQGAALYFAKSGASADWLLRVRGGAAGIGQPIFGVAGISYAVGTMEFVNP